MSYDPIKAARKAEKAAAKAAKEAKHAQALAELAEAGVQFAPFPKIPRLNRDITITEKIDGTNAAIGIGAPSGTLGTLESDFGEHFALAAGAGRVWAQSRGRIITPQNDNAGFAAWVEANKDILAFTLGPGLHFGEWWGQGIQRGYGQTRKFFSLFNFERWGNDPQVMSLATIGVQVVPVLYHGPWMAVIGGRPGTQYPVVGEDGKAVGGMLRFAPDVALEILAQRGSVAAAAVNGPNAEPYKAIEGQRDTGPEGIIVFHKAGQLLFKATLMNDEQPKSAIQQMDEQIMRELEQEGDF